GRRAELLGKLRPEPVGQAHQRQLVYVAAIGAHPAFPWPSGGTTRERASFKQQHVRAAPGKFPGDTRAVDAPSDDDVVWLHGVPPHATSAAKSCPKRLICPHVVAAHL